ncbi:hypothetical protein [Arthrobacter sp. CG_A4]|uniref:hypothetical protein n=1 Tax=Arthrobacter sp. CG_A4 TaxID=3071706 RepID=UPI002E032D5A|nr:hypothetical protein [Arthrobacter sp. CG_A4]
MADSQHDRFLQAATTHVPACDRALGRTLRYGVSTSWCRLFQAAPGPENVFRTAMKKKRIDPWRTGHCLKDPVSADYNQASYPEVV